MSRGRFRSGSRVCVGLLWSLLGSSAIACDGFSCRRTAPAPSLLRAKPWPALHGEKSLESTPVSPNLVVDQFGYRPEASKFLIVADPVLGPNAGKGYAPGASLEVRRFDDGALVFQGAPTPWHGGAIDSASGDRGYWFDFSALRDPGTYVVLDSARRARSYPFVIDRDAYRGALKAALRAFYFNRANIEKKAPFSCVADHCWLLPRNFVGDGQDTAARSVTARDDASTARDLSGGWWDAGDVNKYVTFARSPVHQLLTAYWEKPGPFTDDFAIPESGNGVPDVLDEVLVELTWLKKMQLEDGGVLPKVGGVEHDTVTPDRATTKHFYYEKSCSSSTVAAAGMFAHAALSFAGVPSLAAEAANLRERAIRAFDHYQTHPRQDDCDNGTLTGGDSDRSLDGQVEDAVVAATYLYALTGAASYDEVVTRDFASTRPFEEDRWSAYDPEQGDALLFYTTLANAKPEVREAILERKRSQGKSVDIYGFRPELSLYRAYMRRDSYHWGSNMARANYGNTNYDLLQFKLIPESETAAQLERVAGLLQYFHGINPLGLVYLSNMGGYGAEKSVSELFHSWFRDGDERWDSALRSQLGPAPGFVPGGPNLQYCADAKARCFHSALKSGPPDKAYRDFNTGWAPNEEYDRSWELSEPGIYYQSAYVKLVSKFVD